MKHLILCALLSGFASFSAIADGEIDGDHQIKALPLPAGISLTKIESFSNEPVIKFSQDHSDFAFLDPFLMERREKRIPPHVVMRFETTMKPREVFLFFKKYFNMESRKSDSVRTAPYYNARSVTLFDVENEADISSDPLAAAAVYYRLMLVRRKSG